MDDNQIILFILLSIIIGFVFYFKFIATSQEQKDFEDDNFGDYFVKDIKRMIGYLEELPLSIQKNVYENVCYKYAQFCKETWKLEEPFGLKFKKILDSYIKNAALERQSYISDNDYKNPKWLTVIIFENLLFSKSKKMSNTNGNKIRKYIFFKMEKLLPENKNLKLFIKVEGF